MLMALAQVPHNLIELQPRQLHVVHRHDLIARLQPRFGGRRSRQRLQNDHAPRQHRHHRSEAFALGILHLLELLVLIGIEEDGMRVQRAQHSGNRALINGLLRVHRVRRLCLHDGNQLR